MDEDQVAEYEDRISDLVGEVNDLKAELYFMERERDELQSAMNDIAKIADERT